VTQSGDPGRAHAEPQRGGARTGCGAAGPAQPEPRGRATPL